MKLVVTVLLVSVLISPLMSAESHISGDDGFISADFDILLGKETFDVLNKAHAKKRLEILFGKIDINQDKLLAQDELKIWLFTTIMATFWKDLKALFKRADTNGDGMISWNETLVLNFGIPKDDNDKRYEVNKQEIEQDKRRFGLADETNDGLLTLDECFVFVHPELYDHMKDIITWKFFADLDKNKDGGVSLLEYVVPLKNNEEREKAQQSFEIMDSDGNGKLDVPEALAVLMPDYHRAAHEEASTIMKKIDENEDGKLSLKEVKKRYKVFTDNKHVDFNSQLQRIRDEL